MLCSGSSLAKIRSKNRYNFSPYLDMAQNSINFLSRILAILGARRVSGWALSWLRNSILVTGLTRLANFFVAFVTQTVHRTTKYASPSYSFGNHLLLRNCLKSHHKAYFVMVALLSKNKSYKQHMLKPVQDCFGSS